MRPVALTIAGSDSGGGAGIQADLKTFQELGVFGTSALTAVTAQNTLGVHDVYPVSKENIQAQIDAVLTDFPVGAVKTGMLFSASIIETVTAALIRRGHPELVVDPVMIAKGGASLLQNEAIEAMKESLLPIAAVVTPNIPEAETLSGIVIQTDSDIHKAAEKMLQAGARAVLIKGGHREGTDVAEDMLFTADGTIEIYRSKRIQTKDTHGTGCTFSAAIAANLAAGRPLTEAVREAKQFIAAAIEDGLHLGNGHGPTNHWAYNERKGAVSRG